MLRERISNIRLTVALAVAAIVAALVVIGSFGAAIPDRPFTPVAFNAPVLADSDGTTTAVVDSESHRMLVLDGQDNLAGIMHCEAFDSPIEAITDVCVSGGVVYVAGVQFKPDSDEVLRDRVLVYDTSGNYVKTIFELEGRQDTVPNIKSLTDAPEGVIAAVDANALPGGGNDGMTDLGVCLVAVKNDGSNEKRFINLGGYSARDVGCSSDREQYAALDYTGILSATSDIKVNPGQVLTSIDVSDDGRLFACDDVTGDICVISPNGTTKSLVEGSGYSQVHVNGGFVTYVDHTAGTVGVCDVNGANQRLISSAMPSLPASLHVAVVWVCMAFLIGLALFYGVRKARRLVAAGETEGMGAMFGSIAVVLAVGVAIGSLSFSSYEESLAIRANEVGMCADYISNHSPDLADALEGAGDRDAVRGNDEDNREIIDAIFGLDNYVGGLILAAQNNNIGMYYTIYRVDDRGIYYFIDSAFEHVLGSALRSDEATVHVEEAFRGDLDNDGQVYSGRTLRDATQYQLVQIWSDEGSEVVAVVEVGSKMRSFESSITGDLTRRVIALLVMVLVVYLLYSELRGCGRSVLTYRQLQARGDPGAVAALTRPFTFFITMLSSIDSVMTVLIARDILSAAGIGGSSPLMALPAVMLGIGLVFGQLLYGALSARIPSRKLVVRGSLTMAACALFTVFAVYTNVFWVYCVAKLLLSIPFGLLYTLGYSLPRRADNDETRAAAAGGVKRTDTSALAFGTVLGGYAAETLGDAWVYVVVALACIPVVILALSALPRDAGPLEDHEPERALSASVLHFVKSPHAHLIAFCLILPATLASGYTSFLFPVFSADAGLSKVDINNLAVIGNIVVFACIGWLEVAESRFGLQRIGITSIGFIGLVFLLFSFNTTLVWSVAVVAVLGVLVKASNVWKGLWLGLAEREGVPAGPATGTMFAVRSLTLVAQPFVMAALVGANQSNAAVVLGLFCAACAIVLWRFGDKVR